MVFDRCFFVLVWPELSAITSNVLFVWFSTCYHVTFAVSWSIADLAGHGHVCRPKARCGSDIVWTKVYEILVKVSSLYANTSFGSLPTGGLLIRGCLCRVKELQAQMKLLFVYLLFTVLILPSLGLIAWVISGRQFFSFQPSISCDIYRSTASYFLHPKTSVIPRPEWV